MKLLLYTTPGRGCCGSSNLTIKFYDGDHKAINKKISDSAFEAGEYRNMEHTEIENEIEKQLPTIIPKIKELGRYPDDNACRQIYDLLYENVTPRYVSKYTTEIEELIEEHHYKLRRYCMDGYKEMIDETYLKFKLDENSEDIYGLVFEPSGTKPHPQAFPGMRIYLIKINNGYGCMTSSVSLAIFTDKTECLLFEDKVHDVLKSYASIYDPSDYEWCNCERYIYVLEDDMKSFKYLSCERTYPNSIEE
jgi:hypothetical protein